MKERSGVDKRLGLEKRAGVEERLGKVLGVTAKLVRERFDQRLRSVGSSFPAFMVLQHASMHNELSQRALAERLGIEGPTLVRHIDRLVANGLVRRVRDGHDRRVSRVEVTAAGEAAITRVGAVADAADAELRSLFTAGELHTFLDLLERVREHYVKESNGEHQAVG